MSDAVFVAIIAGTASLAGSIISAVVSVVKARQQNELTLYRIQKLEEKVLKHNNLVERAYALEKRADVADEQMKVANHRIADLEKEVKHHEG